MSLFSKKPIKPTTAEKNEINAMISRVGTIGKRLESVDSVDRYFTEWEKFQSEFERLSYYEAKGIKFQYPLKKLYSAACAEIPRIEKGVITRGYDRMQRDAAKLTTDKGKQKKADAFFGELEFYYPRLQPESVELIKSLRAKTNYISVPPKTSSSTTEKRSTPKFCTQCGASLDSGAKFCGKCGSKV